MSSSDENTHVGTPQKKPEGNGRMSDVMRKIRLQSHEAGESCKCKRLKCYEMVTECERKDLLTKFNTLDSIDKQNAHLAGLISIKMIHQRRSRQPSEDSSKRHDCSYTYLVRIPRDGQIQEIPVCFKAFCSLHGITKAKVEYLQRGLKLDGMAPTDKRGKHNNRPGKISNNVRDAIKTHLKSFKGRSSHYSNKKTSKIYLPEEFNIKKVHELFQERNPLIKLAYDSYRREFHKFNVSFGYPRSDTCSECDKHIAEVTSLDKQKQTEEIQSKLKTLNTENKLHKMKAQVFYDRKKEAKILARNDKGYEALVMDYQKNVSLPNISTNDVYYRRQLSMYSFNIHLPSSGKSFFYTYPETIAKKGSNEVISFVNDFIINHLDKEVKHLKIFCDSAGGQNKNYNMFKYVHFVVHKLKRLESITMTFPIRGHSYMECDKNFGLVKLKTRMETPQDFYELLQNARAKPETFKIIKVEEDSSIVRDWAKFLETIAIYKKNSPFKIQQIRDMYVNSHKKKSIVHRSSYNGPFYNSIIMANKKPTTQLEDLDDCEFYLPSRAYTGLVPLSKPKFNDLQVLKRFCSPESQVFYQNLPHE